MDSLTMPVPEAILKIKQILALSDYDIAERVGLNQSTISRAKRAGRDYVMGHVHYVKLSDLVEEATGMAAIMDNP